MLRGFARFCLREDPATQIPSRSFFGPAHRRLVPHIYTEAELCVLLDAANGLSSIHELRPATCRCVFGLLAASGLRISEALGLTRDDVDPASGVLRIREAKFHRERLLPVYPSVTTCLATYAKLHEQPILPAR